MTRGRTQYVAPLPPNMFSLKLSVNQPTWTAYLIVLLQVPSTREHIKEIAPWLTCAFNTGTCSRPTLQSTLFQLFVMASEPWRCSTCTLLVGHCHSFSGSLRFCGPSVYVVSFSCGSVAPGCGGASQVCSMDTVYNFDG